MTIDTAVVTHCYVMATWVEYLKRDALAAVERMGKTLSQAMTQIERLREMRQRRRVA